MSNKPLITRCTGVNNRLDPKRLVQYDLKTGVTDLAEGQDIDIDDSGQVSSRLGQVGLSTVASHSIFCDGGDCFVAQDRTSDAALYKVGTDFSLSGVRSSLVKGARISYFQVGDNTYYANGTQTGVITSGVSASWPVGTYRGPDTLKEYDPAPIGTHLAYYQGRAWVAVGKVIYCSESFKLGLFRFAKYFFQFGTDVRMIRPVAGGVWVSDSATTGFIAIAETWDGYKYAPKSKFPAHEWSDNCRLVDLGKTKWQIPGLSAVWSSDEGLCIGTPEGQLIVTTLEKLIYPAGANGATVVDGTNVINVVY